MNQPAPQSVRRPNGPAASNRRRRWIAVLLLAAAGLPGGCSETAPPEPADAATAQPPDVEWGYQGELGPERWGGLDPAFSLCAEGLEQSPVNLDSATARDLPDPVFKYAPVRVQLKNDGHTVKAECEGGDSVRFERGDFDLIQFHFHQPAEHRLGDRQHPMEIHFVHRDSANRIAVVGVLVRQGEPHPELDRFWDSLPGRKGEQGYLAAEIELEKLLPRDRRSFRYQGSLTTPPCTEGVHWLVLADAIEASADQLQTLARILGQNNRPIQPRNQREILLDVSRDE